MYLEDKSISVEISYKIYDILIQEAGAHEADRLEFIYAQNSKPEKYNERGGCKEFRFGGKLGFGGKFWNSNGSFYVSAYSEDTGSEEEKTIITVNKLLIPLYDEHLNSKK